MATEIGVKRVVRPQKLPIDDLYGQGFPTRLKELNALIVPYPYYLIVDKLKVVGEKIEGVLVGTVVMEALLIKIGVPTYEYLELTDDFCLSDPERVFDYVLGVSERPNDLEIQRKGTRTDPSTGMPINVIVKVLNTVANKRVEGDAQFDYAINQATVGYVCAKDLYDFLDALP
jgi:hypothetical protein